MLSLHTPGTLWFASAIFSMFREAQMFCFYCLYKTSFSFSDYVEQQQQQNDLRAKEDFWCTNHSLSRTTEWGEHRN